MTGAAIAAVSLTGTVLVAAVTLGLVVLLFAVHESGHYVAGLLLGIPRDRMQLYLLDMPPRVEFSEGEDVASLLRSEDRPNRSLSVSNQRFLVVAGGHSAELVIALVLTGAMTIAGLEWIAARFVLLSAFLAGSYLLVAILTWLLFDEAFGDPAQLWETSKLGAIVFYPLFLGLLAGLTWYLQPSLQTILIFGSVVPLVFVPLAMLAGTQE